MSRLNKTVHNRHTETRSANRKASKLKGWAFYFYYHELTIPTKFLIYFITNSVRIVSLTVPYGQAPSGQAPSAMTIAVVKTDEVGWEWRGKSPHWCRVLDVVRCTVF